MNRRSSAPLPLWQPALAFGLTLVLLCGLIGWLQNVHIVTTNGMYKALAAGPWIADFRTAKLDPSNYLFLPLYGAMCSLLDAAGILRGQAWKQFAYLNAFWASVGSALIYAFAWRLTARAAVAAAATVFHAGLGFVLLLSVISEDIMPGYVVVLAAMLLAALWFDRPTHLRVGAVGALFTLGWLIEWRLLFPALPAFVLALAISEGSLRRRAALIATLVVSVVATAGIVQQVWEGHNGAVGLHDLLWTGKGIDTGWAGLAWHKAWMMLAGIGSYFVFRDVPLTYTEVQASIPVLTLSVVLQLAILAAAVYWLWPQRRDLRLRTIAAVFVGTWGAGEVFNFYSQPQDPQMQINVMILLPVAWLLLLGAVSATRPKLFALLAAVSLAPLVWNAAQLGRHRGKDERALAALAELERRFPPDSTVFVLNGLENIASWQYLVWSSTWDMEGPPAFGVAPSRDPRFKWVAATGAAIRHPGWTPEQHARAMKSAIDGAFDRGYRVVVSEVWDLSEQALADLLKSVQASDRASAIYAMLHDNYSVGTAVTVPNAGVFRELKRK